MEGCFMFQWGIVFQMGEASFLSGGGQCPKRGITFDGGVWKKLLDGRDTPSYTPAMGNPE